MASEENRSVTKRVRLTPTEAETLEELAELQGTSQSEVLREGLRMQERIRKRQANVHKLIELAEGLDEYEKIPWEMRY